MVVDLDGQSFVLPDEEELLSKTNITLAHRQGGSPADLQWIKKTFSGIWADEAAHGWNWFARDAAQTPVGFAAYEQREFRWWWLEAWVGQSDVGIFGPMGVARSLRGKHIGKVLLLRALRSLQERGFRRAVIPAVGPVKFYERWCGARIVERLPYRH